MSRNILIALVFALPLAASGTPAPDGWSSLGLVYDTNPKRRAQTPQAASMPQLTVGLSIDGDAGIVRGRFFLEAMVQDFLLLPRQLPVDEGVPEFEENVAAEVITPNLGGAMAWTSTLEPDPRLRFDVDGGMRLGPAWLDLGPDPRVREARLWTDVGLAVAPTPAVAMVWGVGAEAAHGWFYSGVPGARIAETTEARVDLRGRSGLRLADPGERLVVTALGRVGYLVRSRRGFVGPFLRSFSDTVEAVAPYDRTNDGPWGGGTLRAAIRPDDTVRLEVEGGWLSPRYRLAAGYLSPEHGIVGRAELTLSPGDQEIRVRSAVGPRLEMVGGMEWGLSHSVQWRGSFGAGRVRPVMAFDWLHQYHRTTRTGWATGWGLELRPLRWLGIRMGGRATVMGWDGENQDEFVAFTHSVGVVMGQGPPQRVGGLLPDDGAAWW